MCHKNVTLWNLMKHWSLWVYIWSYHTKYTYIYFKMPSKFYSLILIYAVLSRIYTIFGGQFSGLKMRWGRKKLQISDLVISCTMQCLALRASLLVNSLHLLKNVPEHLVLDIPKEIQLIQIWDLNAWLRRFVRLSSGKALRTSPGSALLWFI